MGKKIKIFLVSTSVVFLAVFAVLCIAVSKKNVKIKTLEKEIVRQELVIDSLQKYNKQLAAINGISVSVEFNMKSTNVLGINTNNCANIAKEIAQYTRGELLDSLSKR